MDVKELEAKTVAELKEIAKEEGISGISSMKKADLVAAIAGAPDTAASVEQDVVPEPEVEAAVEEKAPVDEPAAEEAPAAEEVPAEETAPEEAIAAEVPSPEPEAEEFPVEESAPDEVHTIEESSPEPEADEAPVAEAAVDEAPTEEAVKTKAPEPAPEPPKPEAVPTKTQIWLREKHDIPALKLEKRVLQSQILAAIAEQDYDKLKRLRNRKKELRRLLNRA